MNQETLSWIAVASLLPLPTYAGYKLSEDTFVPESVGAGLGTLFTIAVLIYVLSHWYRTGRFDEKENWQ